MIFREGHFLVTMRSGVLNSCLAGNCRLFLLMISVVSLSCNNHTSGPVDTTRPAPVTDLEIEGIVGGSVHFIWTATGDDRDEGTASFYDLRSAADSSTLINWGGAQQELGEPVPSVKGTLESALITDNFTRPRYFALKVSDESENTSRISNIVCLCQ